jgi:hypothetical protein
MTRQIASAVLATALALCASVAGCSSSHPANQGPAPSAAGAAPSADPALDADDACENMSAQQHLAEFADDDFAASFNARSTDMGAKAEAVAVAESNAVQQVTTGLASDVPDPPIGAIRTWLDAEREYIRVLRTQSLQTQAGLVAVYKAGHTALLAYNAAIEACVPIFNNRH